jgi:hypothetical protein
MIRFLLGAFTGIWIGFAAGFVAGLWLMIRADRDVEEMMREPLQAPDVSVSSSNEAAAPVAAS